MSKPKPTAEDYINANPEKLAKLLKQVNIDDSYQERRIRHVNNRYGEKDTGIYGERIMRGGKKSKRRNTRLRKTKVRKTKKLRKTKKHNKK